MNRKIRKLICLLLVLGIVLHQKEITNVNAATSKTYYSNAHRIKSFIKKNNKLIVKVDRTFYNKKWKKINVRYISYKISANCKWLDFNINYYRGKGPKYRKTNYKNVKEMISIQRSYYIPGKEFDSPVGVTIVVKNGKIVKVTTSGT